MDGQTLGTRIEHIRRNLGDTLEEFGNRFDPPASKGTVHTWENNLYKPNAKRLKHIAKLAGISVDELLHGEGYTPERVEQMLENNPEEIEKIFIENFISDLEDLSFLSNETQKFINKMLSEEHTLLYGRTLAGDDFKRYLVSDVFNKTKKRILVPHKSVGMLSRDTEIIFLSNYISNKGTLAQNFYFTSLISTLKDVVVIETKLQKSSVLKEIEKMTEETDEISSMLDIMATGDNDIEAIQRYKKQILDIRKHQQQAKKDLEKLDKDIENLNSL